MSRLQLFLCFYLAALVTSHDINVKCRQNQKLPPSSDKSPSQLADLKFELVNGINMVNVSWAINIDASVKYLIGTRIRGRSVYLCEYSPPLAEFNLTGIRQKWFHYLLDASYGATIEVANLPLPPLGSGPSSKFAKFVTTPPTNGLAPKQTDSPTAEIIDITTGNPTADPKNNFTSILVNLYLGLAVLMILTSGYIIYKQYGTNLAISMGFKRLPTSTQVPIHVLLVYPPENGAFQKAVMALAEFLQKHAGCSVAIDVWQQSRIAYDGPMRWLAEQVKAAQRVLIVCPPFSRPPPIRISTSTGTTSIPAATHDLYPLILNMVASHAKSSRELAKFWVLQLGGQQGKRPGDMAPELSACKLFCLLKDLNKLCRSLHTQKQDSKMRSTLVFGPGVIDESESMVKLRDSVEKLSGRCLLIPTEAVPVNCVITSV